MFELVKCKTVILALAFAIPAFGAFETAGENAVSLSLAGTGCAYPSSRLSFNPAAIADISLFSFQYSNLFGMKELRYMDISCQTMFREYSFGTEISQFGNSVYHENVFALNVSRRMGEKLYLGARLSVFSLNMKGLGSDYNYNFSAGLIYSPHTKWGAGAAVFNVYRPETGVVDINPPFAYTCGFYLKPGKEFTCLVDIYKEDRFDPEYRLGMECILSKMLLVRTGCSDNPSRLTAGFDLWYGKTIFTYAFQSHRYLGATHTFGVSFNPDRRKPNEK